MLGPFGCGKTRTLCECIELLALHMPNSCMLVCTHSNSAADIYVENLDVKWNSKSNGEGFMQNVCLGQVCMHSWSPERLCCSLRKEHGVFQGPEVLPVQQLVSSLLLFIC